MFQDASRTSSTATHGHIDEEQLLKNSVPKKEIFTTEGHAGKPF